MAKVRLKIWVEFEMDDVCESDQRSLELTIASFNEHLEASMVSHIEAACPKLKVTVGDDDSDSWKETLL